MLAAIINRKLSSSTIIETIVAVLILLLSFTGGMAIYNQLTLSTYSDLKMRANLQQGFVIDSLISTAGFEDQVLEKQDLRFEVDYKQNEIYPQLMIMHLQCYDMLGNKLADTRRMIRGEDEK